MHITKGTWTPSLPQVRTAATTVAMATRDPISFALSRSEFFSTPPPPSPAAATIPNRRQSARTRRSLRSRNGLIVLCKFHHLHHNGGCMPPESAALPVQRLHHSHAWRSMLTRGQQSEISLIHVVTCICAKREFSLVRLRCPRSDTALADCAVHVAVCRTLGAAWA